MDFLDATEMLKESYELVKEFESTINNALDGDHPDLEDVTSWLDRYEASNQ